MTQVDAKSVVVGVNGSVAAVNAATWAVDEAVSRLLPLRLVYVMAPREASPSQPAADWEIERGEMALAQAQNAALAAARHEGAHVEVDMAIMAGHPAQVLVDESACAALVCVGTARRGKSSDGLLGPTAAGLVARAHSPVAVIRSNPDGSPTDLGVIAVVLNDDPDNDDVVHQAMEEGRRRHAIVRQIDRRVDSWVRRYPDVAVQTVAAGTGLRLGGPGEKAGRAIELAVVGGADAERITELATPNCHPIIGYPDCSVLVIRH